MTEIDGVRYGYEGLVQKHGHLPLKLRPETVSNIQSFGGTILGSSRGPQDINEMVDGLAELGVDILFAIGGDGILKCAAALAAEIQRQGLRKSVIAIPKTIDNDIMYLDKSFGFETAFAEAVKAVSCAHVEAICANNGIGLVKLMGGRVRIHRLLRHTVPSSHGRLLVMGCCTFNTGCSRETGSDYGPQINSNRRVMTANPCVGSRPIEDYL